MANPSGANNFYIPQPEYGEKKRQGDLQRLAPIPANPALNAPRRARKQGSRAEARTPNRTHEQVVTTPPPELTYQQQIAVVWADLAAHPDADDLVREYAVEAAKAAGYAG